MTMYSRRTMVVGWFMLGIVLLSLLGGLFTTAERLALSKETVITARQPQLTRPLANLTGITGVVAGNDHSCLLSSGGTVFCWGWNSSGQLGDGTTTQRLAPVAVSSLSSGVIAIAAGGDHSCALTSGGALFCWGANDEGQLGDGTTTDRLLPIMVMNSGVTAVALGGDHSCALTSGGALLCWGGNSYGQLGDGTTTQRLTPVTVNELSSEVTAIDLGRYHSCALRSGAPFCWGWNGYGQLGDGTTTDRLVPVVVSGLSSGVTAVALGGDHSCALRSGAVSCWGANNDGQLGDATQFQRLTPVAVSGLSSGVSAIAAGHTHSCALASGGTLRCWGDNNDGQLGDGTTADRLTPVAVSGLSSGVSAIAAGFTHSCALTSNTTLSCWGGNSSGQLGNQTAARHLTPSLVSELSSSVSVEAITAGATHNCVLTSMGALLCWGWNSGRLGDGTTTQRLTPVDVVGLSSGMTAIHAGTNHTCALTSVGGVKCWGGNASGKLGDGTTTTRLTPVDVVGLNSGIVALAAGESHTCALTNTGSVLCWGDNGIGQLGDGVTIGYSTTPVMVSGLSGGVIALAAGSSHTCALTSTGSLLCWGWNGSGQLGDGTRIRRPTPVAVSGLSSGVIAITAGYASSCALTSEGGVKCWGLNSVGQLGDGTTTDRKTPVTVSGLSSGVTTITTGFAHSCALTLAGGIFCWGHNASSQLGDGTTTDRLTPVAVSGLSSGVSAIVAGGGHSCALSRGGRVSCWGDNYYGQIGDGTTIDRSSPVLVSGLRGGVSSIATGRYHSCALSSDALRCWDDNEVGQLGDGTKINRLLPVVVSGLSSDVQSIATGSDHSCALSMSGDPSCWGANASGQLGDGTTVDRLTPVAVSGLSSSVSAIAAGGSHSCALTSGGSVSCWGRNDTGQLGDGTTTQRLTPVAVSGLSSGVSAIAVGGNHSCALTSGGAVSCWGDNASGQLGDGTKSMRLAPVAVSGLSSGVVAIDLGSTHSCALTSGGAVKCWGGNDAGQLGDGTTTERLTPVTVSGLGSGVSGIAAGGGHSCALSSGSTRCWGGNDVGQLGDGTIAQSLTPVAVSGLSSGVSSIDVGSSHSCALTSRGLVFCWGARVAAAQSLLPGVVIGEESPPTATPTPRPTSTLMPTETASPSPTTGPTQIPLPTPTSSAQSQPTLLYMNYLDGAPGSSFLVIGYNFPPGSMVQLRVNGMVVGSPVMVDSNGSFRSLITMDAAALEGYYVLDATVINESVSTAQVGITGTDYQSYRLTRDAPLHAAPVGAPAALQVPIMIRAFDYSPLLFLPLVRR